MRLRFTTKASAQVTSATGTARDRSDEEDYSEAVRSARFFGTISRSVHHNGSERELLHDTPQLNRSGKLFQVRLITGSC